MSKYIGRLLTVGIAKEASRGAGAAPTYLLPQSEFSFDDKVVKARVISGLGVLEDSEEAFVTTKYGQGNISGEVRSNSFGLLLYALLGAVNTTGSTDKSHAFSIANTNTHQSLSLTVYDPNTTEMYKLAMLESLELTAELDQVVMFNAGFMSKQATGTTQTNPAAISEYKFTKKHLRIKFASNLAGLAAATAISVKSLSLKFAKNTILDDVLGTAEPEDILNRQLSIEGELTLNYEDETYKNYMKNGSYRAMEIAFINSDSTLGGGANPSLTIQLPYVDFYGWEPDNALEDIVKQKFTFKANRDVSGGNAAISTCTLVNAVTSY